MTRMAADILPFPKSVKNGPEYVLTCAPPCDNQVFKIFTATNELECQECMTRFVWTENDQPPAAPDDTAAA